MIDEFRGEYSFLSNFYRFDKPFKYGRETYPSNEHFYIAMKTLDMYERDIIARHPPKGLKARGRSITLREDWEDIKLKVMEYGLKYKFSRCNPNLRGKLLSTDELLIQEGNYWGDTYWGVCLKTGKGDNHLGKLLMRIREEVRNEVM